MIVPAALSSEGKERVYGSLEEMPPELRAALGEFRDAPFCSPAAWTKNF